MERILKSSKRFVLGICNCGCKEIIQIRNKRKSLARYKKSHNIKDFVKHGSDHPSWRGGRTFDKDGYVLVWNPNGTRSGHYILEHVLVMEQRLGRKLNEDEIVHHKNEVKTDNRIENLMVLTDSQHKSYHSFKLWKEGRFRFR